MKTRSALFLALVAASGCGAEPPAPVVAPAPEPVHTAAPVVVDEPTPKVRLPEGTRPTAETLVLTIDPKKDGFSGVVDIAVTLDKPHGVMFLHGKSL